MEYINKDDERVNKMFSVFFIGMLISIFIGAFFGAIITYFFIK